MKPKWVRIRAGLDNRLEFVLISSELSLSRGDLFLSLYRAAAWFNTHGEYGKMRCRPAILDAFVGVPGFSEALSRQGWINDFDGVLCLRYFTDASSARKSLGPKIRVAILSGARCAACGECHGLEIDHKIPVVRGGSCEVENLQALCGRCNAKKGRKTMDEFMGIG